MSSQVILLEDFNTHVDTACSNIAQLKTVLDCFDLFQNVNFPTHPHGHTLDLVCTSGFNNISISGLAIPISDHKLITFDFTLICPTKCTHNIIILHCNIRAVDASLFSASIPSSAISDVLNLNCPCLLFLYHSLIADILDEHAHIRTRSVPWPFAESKWSTT